MSFPVPPLPLVDTILEKAPTAGGRASTAVCETLRILRTLLPPVLERVNGDHQLQIALPQTYGLAGCAVQDKFPALLLDIGVTTQQMAIRVDQDEVSIGVHCVYAHIENERRLFDCLDTVIWARNIMAHFRGAHYDPQGRACWKSLKPRGFSQTMERFPDFNGWSFHFSAWQPGDWNDTRRYWQGEG